MINKPVHKLLSGAIVMGMLLFCFAANSSGQEAVPEKELFPDNLDNLYQMSLEELMSVKLTTASRSKTAINKLPVTIYYISREDIINNNYLTLTDALKDLPGIKVSQPGSGLQGELFLMRGLLGNYYCKILINNLPITPGVLRGMPIGEQINMKNVERIEVMYGPASTLYGADAVAGVINIITFEPDADMIRVESGLGTDLHWHSNGLAAFSVGKDENRVRFIASGLYSRRNDMNIKDGHDSVYTKSDGTLLARGDLPAHNYSFGGQVLWRGFRLSYVHMYRVAHSNIGLTPEISIFTDPDSKWGETIQRAAIQHSGSLGSVSFTSNLSYLRSRIDNNSCFIQDFGFGGGEEKSYKFEAADEILFEEIIEWDITKELELVGGFTAQYSGMYPMTGDLSVPFDESIYSPFSTSKPAADPVFGDFGHYPFRSYNLGGFLQGSYTHKLFSIIAGGRYDYHSMYGYSLNPRVAGQFNFTDSISLRGSFNRAFKAPSPYFNYRSFAFESGPNLNYVQVPNSNLKPEELTSYEAALRGLVTKNISLEIIGTYSIVDKLITQKTVDTSAYPNAAASDTGKTFANDNNAETIIYGVDGIIRVHDIVPFLKLNTDLFLNFAKGKEILAEGDTINDRRMLPLFMGTLRISLVPLSGLYIGIDSTYSGSWYAREVDSLADYNDPDFKHDAYFTMDALIRYEIIKNLSVHYQVNNIFDKKYGSLGSDDGYTSVYNPQYGRSFYGAVEYTQEF
ncbi:MAG: TonB-dependent receptor [bacterium]|nr:TonB-dependent receptor [bacterium]